eukprot:TRINITY_DN80196_c0_g1_i1.p1 TRINITY_DN80196_c0_g1~~TRINITY_DN80196_c0_g1_i1.p1  ORF type:complete len:155 (+),score=31.83 TRINITY_DN80196_c0_g1_i1:147-611(+)
MSLCKACQMRRSTTEEHCMPCLQLKQIVSRDFYNHHTILYSGGKTSRVDGELLNNIRWTAEQRFNNSMWLPNPFGYPNTVFDLRDENVLRDFIVEMEHRINDARHLRPFRPLTGFRIITFSQNLKDHSVKDDPEPLECCFDMHNNYVLKHVKFA